MPRTPEIDAFYTREQLEIHAHTEARKFLEQSFAKVAEHAHRPLEIEDQLPPFEERFGRTVQRAADVLPVLGLSLSQWADLLDFHDVGIIGARIGVGMVDWLEEHHPDVLAAMAAAGVFTQRREDETDESRREIEVLSRVRTFWRKCEPAVRRRGYARFMALGENEAGVALWQDRNGVRAILVYDRDDGPGLRAS